MIRRVRSAKVDNVDVDLLVETDWRVYVVEVRPRVEDVGALLAKAEVVKAALGKEAVPILTGAWIGDDVDKYARGKDVLVYSY
ncbi:paREP7 [Pyrobaculum oguniense TE7]|uniref:PaREP7 n=1 Tax=Pyrobaculum oguniense (strain DSM 13380 / JCM 10595 / TE7) TaxID=698757 RepID=H6Q7U0_PYROT|nr:paREP7 [Pyrobaculum oguniense TE7]